MILIALAAVAAVTVPLTGGRLARLGSLQLRALWLPMAAVAVQVAITVVATGGSGSLHRVLHLLTYALIAAFVYCNRRVPGVFVMGAGGALNALAIAANRGVMPASVTAERLSGLQLRAGFDNSAPLSHPHLLWLGDVIPWPGPLPNVLSIGDCLIYVGLLVLLHRTCGRRVPEAIRLRPLPHLALYAGDDPPPPLRNVAAARP
jgi:hypothetical protein